jgi:hypothetical protein
MYRRIIIILIIFLITIVACMAIFGFALHHSPSSDALGVFFSSFFLLGLLLFAESIILFVIYIKHLKELWFILLPVFLISSTIPIYLASLWFQNRPPVIPSPGPLSVSFKQYTKDKEQVIADFRQNSVNQKGVTYEGDTIIDVKIDSIIYSIDLMRFFAIIIGESRNGDKIQYCSFYRVGQKKQVNGWELASPKGNIWSTCFDSVPELKDQIRKYFYKRYSINGSSDQPEIWNDGYIFSFNK